MLHGLTIVGGNHREGNKVIGESFVVELIVEIVFIAIELNLILLMQFKLALPHSQNLIIVHNS